MPRILLLLMVFLLPSTALAGQEQLELGINEYQAERFEEAQEILAAAQKEQPTSSAVAYHLGLALKQTGNLEQAVANLKMSLKLEPMVSDAYPELIELLYLQNDFAEAGKFIAMAESAGVKPARVAFLKGQVLAGNDNSEGAVAALIKAKEIDPALAQQADFQIAQIYLKQGDRDKAQESLKSVISGDPSSELAGFAREYERRLTAAAPRNWHIFAGVNLQYDDNVVVKPSQDVPGLFLPTPHDWSSNQNLRILYEMPARGPWLFNGQYSLYNNSYFKRDEYSQLSQGVTLAPAYRLTPQLMFSLPVSFNYTLLSYEAYSNQVTVKPTATAFFASDHLGQASFGYSRRNYLQNTVSSENRDADGYAGQMGYIYLFAEERGFFNLRYEFSLEDAQGNNWSYLGNRLNADLLLPLASRTSVIISLEGFWQNYLNNHTVYGMKREDATYAATVNLSHELTDGIFVNFQYFHASDFSNLALYEYDRNVYSTGVEVRF
ncbi:TPR domain protein [Geotalea daltonii FRC-32]|uniref:TPR domain protein n=1 Tax=Geotalea daltonii (strain DSM 22248 / JCM 15807 / FRC-32) TaxID=316067 RepID=B9M6J4_GEODF|nr:tetratricopeptide repeat protein [Geotalea daltonii]ACM20054.1 TPR domain protein [Geotalea daltonii FRC-32]